MLTLQALTFIEGNNRTGWPIWNYATGKGAKPVRIIQLNSGEVRTHARCKTTRTWENFNNRETNMIPFSGELQEFCERE